MCVSVPACASACVPLGDPVREGRRVCVCVPRGSWDGARTRLERGGGGGGNSLRREGALLHRRCLHHGTLQC